MGVVLQIALGSLLYGFALWGAIKILDRYNTYNTLRSAMFIGVVLAVVMPVFGWVFAAMPMAGLLFTLVFSYDLGYVRGLLVIALEAVLLYVANVVLTDLLGDAEGANAVVWLIVLGGLVGIAYGVRSGVHLRAAGWLEARGKRRAREADRKRDARPVGMVTRAAPPAPAPMKQDVRAVASARSELPEPGTDPNQPRFLR